MNFEIQSDRPISQPFLNLEKTNFWEAAIFVQNLDYKRNSDKHNPLIVLQESCGTCSSKHALLKRLIDENEQSNFQFMLGIFRMNGDNAPKIKSVLEHYNLAEIPEAHNYLKWNHQILDFTSRTWRRENFMPYLLKEIEIQPEQITDFKIKYHQNFLQDWLNEHSEISYSVEEIWNIREECIVALSQ